MVFISLGILAENLMVGSGERIWSIDRANSYAFKGLYQQEQEVSKQLKSKFKGWCIFPVLMEKEHFLPIVVRPPMVEDGAPKGHHVLAPSQNMMSGALTYK